MTKSALLQTNLGGFDHLDLERIAETLEQAGLLIVGSERRGSKIEITYTLTKKLVETLASKMGGAK